MTTSSPQVSRPALSEVRFRRTRLSILLYLMLAYYSYTQSALGPAMPFIQAELRLSYTEAGYHLSAFAAGVVVTGLLADRVLRRVGRRRAFWIGGAGMACGILLLTQSETLAFNLFATFSQGVFGAFVLILVQAVLSDLHGEHRTLALTESNVVASVSSSLAPLVVGTFQRTAFSWRAALLLAAVAWLFAFVRYRHLAMPQTAAISSDTPVMPPAAAVRLPLRFWGAWLLIFLGVAVEWAIGFWGAFYLQTRTQAAPTDAATTMTLYFAAAVVARIAGTRLARRISPYTILLVSLGVAFGGLVIFWQSTMFTLSAAALFFAGLGIGNLFPMGMSIGVGIVPEHANNASARISLATGIAILAVPQLLGFIADSVDLYTAYAVAVALVVAALVVAVVLDRSAR